MMRENHLQSLPVVDGYKRIVGTITMRDIAAFEGQRRIVKFPQKRLGHLCLYSCAAYRDITR